MGEILQFIGEAIAGLLVFAVIAVVVIWLFIMWLNDWETPSSRRRQQQVIDDEPDYRTMTLEEAYDVLEQVRQAGYYPDDPYEQAVVNHAENMVRQAQGA
ncbi:hypothetical protein [Actinomycetospora sp. NBC_00405]|uniref:hypothetical protein n=1 Tax=Actinomycetospora sp. NBC_00405 TaxID=2975952 RepID=UPI002E1AAD6F